MAQPTHNTLTSFEDEVTAPIITIHQQQSQPSHRFVSLRWRLLFPITIVVLIVITIGSYIISDSLTKSYDNDDTQNLLTTSQLVATEAQRLGNHHSTEIYRIANTGGVRENIASQNEVALQSLIEPNAMLAGLDLVVITDAAGSEILGLQRTQLDANNVDYAVAESSDLSTIDAITTILDGDANSSTSIISTNQGLIVVSAEAIYSPANEMMGIVAVGTRLDHVIVQLQGNQQIELAAFSSNGNLLRTTLPDDESILSKLSLDTATIGQVISSPGQVPIETTKFDGTRYQTAYFPFVIDNLPVGVIGAYMPSKTPFATDIARQLFSLFTTLLSAGVVIIGYLVIGRAVQRIELVRDTAQALADGHEYARTNFQSNDEIGQLASALDGYAVFVQQRTGYLVSNLQRQRRESARLTAVIENMPDGLVILDLDGRVLMMNTIARKLIGGISTWRTADFHKLTATITDTLGPSLAPGIYSLGDPSRIAHNEKILQAQAAVVMSIAGKKLGMIVTLREVTDDVQREQRYESLLEELARDVQLPIAHIAQNAALSAVDTRSYGNTEGGESLLSFAREIARNARSMQRIIAELRELNTFTAEHVEHGQRPILLSDLLWQLAAQWKPSSTAATIDLHIKVPSDACYVLGDERRLNWALGNIIDNAIKYSLPGSTIRLIGESDPESSLAHVQIVDEGVGILPDNLPQIFQRFYRGQPTLSDGSILSQPGTGQGLFLTRKVLHAHGGEITVESAPQRGTTVHLWLPMTASVTLEMPEEITSSFAAPTPVYTPINRSSESVSIQSDDN
jgi:signal transduction histidine kinase